jgi:hypothetical protein
MAAVATMAVAETMGAARTMCMPGRAAEARPTRPPPALHAWRRLYASDLKREAERRAPPG